MGNIVVPFAHGNPPAATAQGSGRRRSYFAHRSDTGCLVGRETGTIAGGLVGRMINKPAPGVAFHPAGIFMSILGAIALVLLWRWR